MPRRKQSWGEQRWPAVAAAPIHSKHQKNLEVVVHEPSPMCGVRSSVYEMHIGDIWLLVILLLLQLYLHIYIHINIWNQDNYDMYPDNNHRNDNYHDTIYIYTLSIYQDSSESYIYVSNPWGYLQIFQSLDHDLVLKQPWWLGNPPLKNYITSSYVIYVHHGISLYIQLHYISVHKFQPPAIYDKYTDRVSLYIYIHNVYMYTI
jgi:hypothetical protein